MVMPRPVPFRLPSRGAVNHMWTISALQMHEHGIIVCDEEAADELKVSTYKYFKDIEQDQLL